MHALRRTAVGTALLALAGMAVVHAMVPAGEPAVALREEAGQVVVYTIHRGPYEQVGGPIGQLFMKVMQNGMMPQGAITLAYLNNPEITEPAHLLTEVRVPVGEGALEKAGTLGDFTDVKAIPALQYAVIRKPKGDADPAVLRETLYAWVRENGYDTLDACCERFLTQTATTDYAQMETEIMVPVARLEE